MQGERVWLIPSLAWLIHSLAHSLIRPCIHSLIVRTTHPLVRSPPAESIGPSAGPQVTSAAQGDRVGLCVTQFDPKLLERGLVCSPGSLLSLRSGIASVRRVPYFRGAVSTRAKFHVTIGHETVLARVSFFGAGGGAGDDGGGGDDAAFDFSRDYAYQDEFLAEQPKDRAEQVAAGMILPSVCGHLPRADVNMPAPHEIIRATVIAMSFIRPGN